MTKTLISILGKSIRHVASGLCVHPEGGVAYDGVKLVLWAGCDQERLSFHFLLQGELLHSKGYPITLF